MTIDSRLKTRMTAAALTIQPVAGLLRISGSARGVSDPQKSTFLPRFLGIFSLVGGLGWLTFLVPQLGYQLFMIVAGFALLGSLATILWLFIVGVDEKRWKEQSIAAARAV